MAKENKWNFVLTARVKEFIDWFNNLNEEELERFLDKMETVRSNL
jgi:hypothetical protein